MIENIDTNFGRLMKRDDAKLADNTLVIFLTDNGPGGMRWNVGLRNRKGSVYEGVFGCRATCAGRRGSWAAAPSTFRSRHIDVTPTLLELCNTKVEGFDGHSFARMLTGGPVNWSDRTLFFQWHRGDEPEKYRAFAVRGPGELQARSGGRRAAQREMEAEVRLRPRHRPLRGEGTRRRQAEVVALEEETRTWSAT